VFGNVSLAVGFQHSINSVFCNVGKQIGRRDDPRLLTSSASTASPASSCRSTSRAQAASTREATEALLAKNPATQVDPGRLASGRRRMS